jgi:hypothetical protein
VKLVAIGAVERRTHKEEEEIVTSQLTYFARMADAETFAYQASAEVRRRGIERARAGVCHRRRGRVDPGRMSSGHRHDALRILDAGACGWLHQ